MRDDRADFDRLVEAANEVHPDRLSALRRPGHDTARTGLVPVLALALVTLLAVIGAAALLMRTGSPERTRIAAVVPSPTATETRQLASASLTPTAGLLHTRTAEPAQGARTGADVLPIKGRVTRISVLTGGKSPAEPGPREVVITNQQEIDHLVELILSSPVDPAANSRKGLTGPLKITFHLDDGGAVAFGHRGNVIEPYGIVAPAAFWTTVNQAVAAANPRESDTAAATGTPTASALAKSFRLPGSNILLESTDVKPKVSRQAAIERAQKQVGGRDRSLQHAEAAHWLATNTAVQGPAEPSYLQQRPVWVVTISSATIERGPNPPYDAPPNRVPTKKVSVVYVLIDSETGRYLLTVSSGTGLGGQSSPVCGGSTLEDARKKWQSAGVRSYDLELSVRAFGPDMGTWKLQVRNGSVTRASFSPSWDTGTDGPNDPERYAAKFEVEQLFDIVEQGCREAADAAQKGKVEVEAAFDPKLGYLTHYKFDLLSAIDDEYELKVRWLQPR
ncbi:MAG: DUF6174 domain-containing protein [Chloroflexota bacterium]|nr:DUF6174 domain-containing protein [Chloroflexota bacterium]